MPDVSEDDWRAETTAKVDRIIDALEGPAVGRLDGSVARARESGLLAKVDRFDRKVDRFDDDLSALRTSVASVVTAKTKLEVPGWIVTLLVALIGVMGTIAAATIAAVRAVS